jgi:CubicO group peptidase (beta-lactamase class C family)
MTPVDLSAVARLVVDDHAAAPCAVVGAAIRGQTWRYGYGVANAELNRVFDLASVSKPITALTLARCQRAGLIDRAEPLVACLPALADTATAAVPLDLLSAHRAGLEAHREFFVKQQGVEQAAANDVLLQAADLRRPECVGAPPPDGFAPVYSDLGYILVGACLSARGDMALDALVAREVAAPLGVHLGSARQQDARLGDGHGLFVPTEVVPWRGGQICGVVHDENAWVLSDRGSSGHAGMFGDVSSVVALGVAIVDALAGRRDEWLRPDELAPLLRRRPGGTHCAGFDRRGEQPSSGAHFGPETFGHLGFTGTSLWIDPERELVGVLLTNRVNPTRESLAIRKARPAAYDAIFSHMV